MEKGILNLTYHAGNDFLKNNDAKSKASSHITGLDSESKSPKKNLLIVDSNVVRKSTAFLAMASPANLFDQSTALKKSTMMLSQLGGTLDTAIKPALANFPKIDINSAAINNDDPTKITQSNISRSDRPQVWTKSTTNKAPDTITTRRQSINQLINQSSIPSKTGRSRGDNKAQQSLTENDLKHMIQNINTLENKRNSIVEDPGIKFAQFSSKKLVGVGEEFYSKDSLNSKASILLENLLKNIDQLGKPLRGPIIRLLFALYTFCILLIFASWYTNFAPNIQFFTSATYFVLSFLITQICRIVYAFDIGSILPVYMSLAPFFCLIFISRESHQLVFVLWFVSTSLIFLQTGHPLLRVHLVVYTLLIYIFYIVALVAMSIFYSHDCDLKICGQPLDPQISIPGEVVMLVNSLALMVILLSLEGFIKLNALELLERDTFMSELVEANVALKKQLHGEEEPKENSLEIPLTRATNILTQIKEDTTIDRMVADEIDFVLQILSQDANNLFVPNLYQKPADSDVHDWLNDLMLTDKTPNNVSSILISQKNECSNPMLDQTLIFPEDSKIFDYMASRFDDPEFDVFELYDLAKGSVLYYVGWYIFRKYEYAELYGMNETKFRRWLSRIEAGYFGKNPYHNAMHAADVTHSMHYYVSRPRIWGILRPEEKLSVLIAPIIHDYRHPGLNNAFMISTRASLAIRYNDLCVLENFHASSVFELMVDDSYNIFESFSPEAQKLIREFSISMVLSTDMAAHFDWIGKFKNKLAGSGLNLDVKPDRKLLLNMAMKCADINNPTKKLRNCKKWTDMIMKEFFAQGEEEKRLGLKVSMFMDKNTTDIPKCQIVSFKIYKFTGIYRFLGKAAL